MARKIKFFEPSVKTGWKKTDTAIVRRRNTLKAHKGDLLTTGRSLQALANTSQDKKTAELAGLDARHFFRRHKKSK